MTICEPHPKHTHHPFLAPEEEDDVAHIYMTLRFVLIIFGLVPVITFLVAIWVAAHPHLTDVDLDPEYTKYVKENFQFNETGNGDIFIYDENGTTIDLGHTWNKMFVYNMSHYTFGFGNASFCNKRNATYKHDWSTSIFRATQLYSSVQTGMRYGLLIVMLPMILTAYIITKTNFIEQKTFTSFLIGTTYVCNEILFYVSTFLLTALHCVFDEKYIPYDSFYFSIALILSMSKLMLRNFTEAIGLSTFLRCIGILIFIVAWAPLKEDIEDYNANIYCDTFAPPKVCILQLLCIFVLFCNSLYDVHESRIFNLVVSPAAEEISVQKILKNTVFRRQKPVPIY